MSTEEMVRFILEQGTDVQKAALDALLDYAEQVDGEWGGCQEASWFREHPQVLDERDEAILRGIVS